MQMSKETICMKCQSLFSGKTRKTPNNIMDGFFKEQRKWELSLLHVKQLLVLLFINTKYESNSLTNKGNIITLKKGWPKG